MERIGSIDDPRVAAYRSLPDRTLRGENVFVTEGRILTRRLLESSYPAESVFVVDRFADEFASLVGDRVPLYVASEQLLREVVGFKFHLGVLGCGRRASPPSLDDLLARKPLDARLRLIVCPEIAKPENLGLVFRTAAAFGIDGLVLGRGCDPFSRRALRLSMGGTLQVPFCRSKDVLSDLERLKTRWQVELVAAVLDERAERLCDVRFAPRTALVFGHEYHGVRDPLLALCDRLVTIPMHPSMDSLNLGVAAGIFVYEMSKGRST